MTILKSELVSVVNDELNRSYSGTDLDRQVIAVLKDLSKRGNFLLEESTRSTVISRKYYSMPAHFKDKLVITIDDYYPLEYETFQEYQTELSVDPDDTDYPRYYTWMNKFYYLRPMPDAVYTIRQFCAVYQKEELDPATLTQTTIAFVDGGASEDTITDSSSNFVEEGFVAGDSITIAGSTSNDGTYTIITVVAGTINVATASLTAEAAGDSVTITAAANMKCCNKIAFDDIYREAIELGLIARVARGLDMFKTAREFFGYYLKDEIPSLIENLPDHPITTKFTDI